MSRLEPFPDALVALEVGEGEARIGPVPELSRLLVAPLVVLELVFDARAARYQPARARPADAVAEGQVKAPGCLVDEVVHIGLVAAVVVAGEDDSALVVEKCPEGEMDCLHACQEPVREDVAGGVV